MKKTIIMLFALTVMMACNNNGDGTAPAIDTANFDTSVSPGADFYGYVNGGWQKRNPLKPEFSRFGRFDELQEQNVNRVNDLFKEILDEPADSGSVNQKIADLYRLGLDSTRLNEEGAAPLRPYIEEVYTITDLNTLAEVVAKVHRNGGRPFYGVYAGPDAKDSNTNVAHLEQGGLGLGNRDYYVDTTNAAIHEGYRNFLAKALELAGIPNPEKVAGDAVDVEDALAQFSWSNVERRDSWKTYNPTNHRTLLRNYPDLHFDTYAETAGIAPQNKIIVGEPSYFKELNAYLKKTPVEKLRNYVLAGVVRDACGYLSDEFSDASFEFFSRQLAGAQEQKPRWKRSQATTERLLGQPVGQIYVQKYFSPEAKEKAQELVSNIIAAYRQHIDSLDWMTDATKAKAQEKLAAVTLNIGYPDKWKDFSTLAIDPNLPLYENIVRANNWNSDDNLSKLGQPVDKGEWGMTPQTVNAFYNPSENSINFPAAILQPPFYNPDADDAVNYGA
ncbi:MAG: M13 family metallopeptidase, partial [Bacteroidales bacterium]|nr:M13 family metallopeptidase [Bacteroidales bacterium]